MWTIEHLGLLNDYLKSYWGSSIYVYIFYVEVLYDLIFFFFKKAIIIIVFFVHFEYY